MAENHFRFRARVDRTLRDHEERISTNEERLDRHEQDIADLNVAAEALKRIEARRPKAAKRKR